MLNQPTNKLLEEFGKGVGMPGAGGVAILSVMSATQLLVSVCKLTMAKPKYSGAHDEISTIQNDLEREYIPSLERLMQEDVNTVKEMLRYRVMRDKETDKDKKEEYKQKADALLHTATQTVMEFCSICLEMLPMALHVYRRGLRSAQGDTGVAISMLVSCAASGLFAALINIKASKGAGWAHDMRVDAEMYFGRLHEYKYIFSGKLASLYNNAWSGE